MYEQIRDFLKENGVDGRKAPSMAKKIISMLEDKEGEEKKPLPGNPNEYIKKTKPQGTVFMNNGHIGIPIK